MHQRRVFAGIQLVIDRPKGFVQTGRDSKGNTWVRRYSVDYGYVPRTEGGDKEDLDVFVGPNERAPVVYVFRQNKEDGSFDEFKAFLGFESLEAARKTYAAHVPARYIGPAYQVPTEFLRGVVPLNGQTKAAAQGGLGALQIPGKLFAPMRDARQQGLALGRARQEVNEQAAAHQENEAVDAREKMYIDHLFSR